MPREPPVMRTVLPSRESGTMVRRYHTGSAGWPGYAGVSIPEGRSIGAIPGAGVLELSEVLVFQQLAAAQLVCRYAHLGEVLTGFHLHEGVEQVFAVGHHSMIRQEDSVIIREKWLQARSDL